MGDSPRIDPHGPDLGRYLSTKNVVHTIDGKRAFRVFSDRAAALGVELRPENTSDFLQQRALGLQVFGEVNVARTALSAGPDGSLTFAAEVPAGTRVSIIESNRGAMLIRSVIGAPTAGFLAYGEIARYGGILSGWHNATAVVLAIPA